MPEKSLTEVWRVCNKIRAAIFRVGLNLWDYFLPLDATKSGLLSESQFVSVLAGPLKSRIGINNEEIGDLTDYFKVQDGRVHYSQFCRVIHESIPDFGDNPPYTTGLEWEDPYHVNVISQTEERRLQLILTKIATTVNQRRLVLRPYFQDYEMLTKNAGAVTVGHFGRVLSFLGISLSAEDFRLLLKKFLKDGYTINYVAFLAAITDITHFLEKKGLMDYGGDLLPQFPGRAIHVEIPNLPRPELGHPCPTTAVKYKKSFHPCLELPPTPEDTERVIHRIQQYVLSNRIRVNEFFKQFDPMRSGRVTVSQFRRGLDNMGLSTLKRLYLSEPEINALCLLYQDPNDPGRICWNTFESDIDTVFAIKNLERYPALKVDLPPHEITTLPRKGLNNWAEERQHVRDICEEAVARLKKTIKQRRINVATHFRDYDRINSGHVSRTQFRQCLGADSLLCSEEELYAMEQRYCDDVGFNYIWFLKEADPPQPVEGLFDKFLDLKVKLNKVQFKPKPTKEERDITCILAKIRAKVVRERIRLMEFLKDYDRTNEKFITRSNFFRALGQCQLELTEVEMETLADVFAMPMQRNFIDYKKFSEIVEEAFTQPGLERAPLLVPLQHVPPYFTDYNFLNYEERRIFSMAMEKLSKKKLNLLPNFKDFDITNCGSVPRNQFLRVLSMHGLSVLLSPNQLEVIQKCFAINRGMQDEVDYRAFVQALDYLVCISGNKPF